MKISAHPYLFILHFDFFIGEFQFKVELKQNVTDPENTEIRVKNLNGIEIEEPNIVNTIKEYALQTDLSFDEIRQSAWINSVHKY